MERQQALCEGKWLVSQGGELEWSSGDKWNVILEIPAGAIVEYKYVLLEGDGLSAIAWQQGNNNVLAVGHTDDNVEVFDTWESGPGAAVMAAGESSTREGRMLAWATEVETLFASQVRTPCCIAAIKNAKLDHQEQCLAE